MSDYANSLETGDITSSPGRELAAREVLDMHADLQRLLAKPTPRLRDTMLRYLVADAKLNPAWAASHMHPVKPNKIRSDADFQPWIDSLSTDLFGATTYQVTAEMVDLAEALKETTPDLSKFSEDELPSPWGFMWLDKPIPRPSVNDNGRPPLMMHAFSWAKVPEIELQVKDDIYRPDWGDSQQDKILKVPGLRVREWGWTNDLDVTPRPLFLIGQSTITLDNRFSNPLPEHWTLHMLWILMGMEIVSNEPGTVERATRKRAANLRYQDVRVVKLRRPRNRAADPGEHRTVEWSCTWLVRGHWRNAPKGGMFKDGRTRTWVKPYLKGPDGLPLRASDVLYKLSR